MTKPIPTEHAEQVCFVQWFKLKFPNVRIAAIPNGGFRHQATAKAMKAEGQSPGFPDLFIPEWRMFIEMKRSKGGSVSPEQKEWLGYLESHGYRCFVCKGFEQAKDVVLKHIDTL